MTGRVASKVKSKRNVKSLNDSEEKKDDDDFDASILSKPSPTSVSGLPKAVKLLNAATEEVRDYLTFECELLYECRICRNIFRSITNFIQHKRNYCQERYNCVIHVKCSNNVENSTNISETATVIKNDEDEKKDKTGRKSLSSLIDNLAQRKQFGFERNNFSINEFYKGSEHGVSMNLDRIDGTGSGVYQTIAKTQDDCENKIEELQLEVAEIHSMLEGQSVVLGPDGKIIDVNKGNNTRTGLLATESLTSNLERTCEECNVKFATRKTYLSHMKYKHADSRLVYPCPDCSEVYASPWSVYRHLFNIHRKTLAQVRKLRDAIQSKAYNQTQPTLKNSPKSTQDITEQERIDDENLEWMANFETDNDMQMCGGCGKRFERRAALNSHSQTCQKRIAARNTIVVNKSKRSAGADDKGDKKSVKIPKLDSIPEVKNADKRKSSVILRKRKTGSIQIRYDYIKTNNNNKSLMSGAKVEALESKSDVADGSEGEKGDVESKSIDKTVSENSVTSELVSNTEELYSIIGIPTDSKTSNGEENSNHKSDIAEAEVLSIHSSNNTTPNKNNSDDPLQLGDETDSEIEEIFNSSNESNKTDYFPSETLPEPKYKVVENNIYENTLKIINLIGSDQTKSKISLDDKMFEYVDMKKLQCKPCNTRFNNISKLRCHMSMHFNWMRYCCDICSRKAYEKATIYEHIERDHNVLEQDKIEAVIFQLPDWETYELSSKEFIEVNNDSSSNNNLCMNMSILTLNPDEQANAAVDDCVIVKNESFPKDGETQVKASKGRGRPPKKNNLKGPKTKKRNENEDEDNKTEDKKFDDQLPIDKVANEITNMQDNDDLRKMVFEVIFGQNSENTVDSDNLSNKSDSENSKDNDVPPEVNNVSSRPVRNRVKPVNKDFIYDLNSLVDGTRSVSQNTNRSLPERHITGSMEDLSGNKMKYLVKKSGKRPGPKCKTVSVFNLNDCTSFDLQNDGSENEIVQVPEDDFENFSTKRIDNTSRRS